jgi:hypothetical protein
VRSPHRGASSVPAPRGAGTPEGARRREWRSGGSAHRRAANTDHDKCERWCASFVRARRTRCAHGERKRGERRVGVHGAVFSSELSWNSGEQLPRIGALARRAKASTGCTKGRRCSDEDGGSGGELWWPERPTTASARTITKFSQ